MRYTRKIQQVVSRLKKILFTKKETSISKNKKFKKEKNFSRETLRQQITPQATIESSKFDTVPRFTQTMKEAREDLPVGYGDNIIILQVRDPWWLHCYWEVKEKTIQRLRSDLKDEFNHAAWILRIYDVSYIIFDGANANKFFDIHLDSIVNNWYINVLSGCSYVVDLGIKLKDGRFITIVRSNCATTPLDAPSFITDEEWLSPDDEFARLYNSSLFGSSPLGRKRKSGEFISSSGLIASFGARNKSP